MEISVPKAYHISGVYYSKDSSGEIKMGALNAVTIPYPDIKVGMEQLWTEEFWKKVEEWIKSHINPRLYRLSGNRTYGYLETVDIKTIEV